MSIAGAWYSSGTFWTAAGVVVALLVGSATVAVTYLTRFARQRLDYGLRTVAPLLTAPDVVGDELEVLHRGERLESPHLAEVVLVGRGRRDIPRAAFENDEPLVLTLDVPIVEVLQVRATDSASSTPRPPVWTDGRALGVGPALIGRRQRIIIRVLVQGAPRGIWCAAPLPNAVVQRAPQEGEQPLVPLRELLWGPQLSRPAYAVVTFFVIAAIVFTFCVVSVLAGWLSWTFDW